MASPDTVTTPANVRFFFLGVFVALCVAGIFSVGSRVFFAWQRSGTPLVTGEQDLDSLVRTDVDLFWTFTPNLKNREVTEVLADNHNTPSTYTYSTNELGFRSPPLKPRGSRFRILAIGDSTTFGQHLADEETWPAQLQHLLDPDMERVEVINAGVIGASSFQGLAFLHTRGLALEPDLVIATFGFNDWARAELSDLERARAYKHSGVRGMLNQIVSPARPTANEGMVQRASPGEYLDHMHAIARLCEENAVPVIFLIWPNPFEVENPLGSKTSYRPLLEEVCRISSAECLDLLTPFKSAGAPVFLDWIHATSEGCGVVAQVLTEHLRHRQLVPHGTTGD